MLHIVNGGLDIHEVVIGDGAVQDAWEAAEAPLDGAPPGPTPVASVAADVGGVRVVVPSGQRVDLLWEVPADVPVGQPIPSASATPDPSAWTVECHIPGHLAKGMWIPIRLGRSHALVSGAGGTLRACRLGVRRAAPPFRRTPNGLRDRRAVHRCADHLVRSVCPVDCIHYDEGTDRKLFIDPNECIDCGACEPECPVNAIFPEESLPSEWAKFTTIDATWYTDKFADRAPRSTRLKPPADGSRGRSGLGARAPFPSRGPRPTPMRIVSSSRPPRRSSAPSASVTSWLA